MKEPHKQIFLQCCNEDGVYVGHLPGVEVTWCEDQINKHDVKYLRADVVDKLQKQLDAAERIFAHFGGLGKLAQWENADGESAQDIVRAFLDAGEVNE